MYRITWSLEGIVGLLDWADPCRLWGLEAAPGIAISPVEEFSGVSKVSLRSFILHCRNCAEFWLC